LQGDGEVPLQTAAASSGAREASVGLLVVPRLLRWQTGAHNLLEMSITGKIEILVKRLRVGWISYRCRCCRRNLCATGIPVTT